MGIINSSFYSISTFLPQHTYHIPEYQRGYSWEEDQLHDFWQDLIQLVEDEDLGNHFLGQIVVHYDREQKKWFIIDGQQRTSTSVIFLDVLRTLFLELSESYDIEEARDDSDDITSTLIGRFSEKKQSQKLVLGDVDKKLFETIIQKRYHKNIESINIKNLRPSEILIYKARIYLKEQLLEFIDNESDPNIKYEKLSNLYENFIENFKVMYIETDDVNEAFIIFETLNARGKDLETSDLLKNHIFRHSGIKLEQVKKDWDRTIENLNNVDPTRFIRHYWNSQYTFTREKDLYKQIKKNIDTPKKVENLTNDLLKLSELYTSLNSPEDNTYYQHSDLNERIKEINNLGASSFFPIILAMETENFNENEINKVLSRIESLIVRNFVVSGKVANRYEIEFSKIAYNISQQEFSNLDKILISLNKGIINDEEFEHNFNTFTTKKTPVIRYLLRKINNYSNKETIIRNDNNNIHIEHIMPKKPKLWELTEEVHDEYLWKLGNLTLLGQEYNKKATNNTFADKKVIYAKSSIPMSKELTSFDNWTPTEISNRQENFTELALKIWYKE